MFWKQNGCGYAKAQRKKAREMRVAQRVCFPWCGSGEVEFAIFRSLGKAAT
jgi:hypothetical protein